MAESTRAPVRHDPEYIGFQIKSVSQLMAWVEEARQLVAELERQVRDRRRQAHEVFDEARVHVPRRDLDARQTGPERRKDGAHLDADEREVLEADAVQVQAARRDEGRRVDVEPTAPPGSSPASDESRRKWRTVGTRARLRNRARCRGS